MQFNPVALGQGRAQRILVSHLEKYGCQVETGTELKSFEQHEDHVMYQLKKKASDGTITEEEAQASYVIGTDGARGTTRFSISQACYLWLSRSREENVRLVFFGRNT